MMDDISVIIVSYNGAAVLPRCLAAVQAAAAGLHVQTIVVDNGSTDGSITGFDMATAPLELVQLDRNYSITKALNIGLRRARGRYLLLLNSDCFIHPHLLRTLCASLDADPRIGLIGPRLHNVDGSLQPSCHNDPSPCILFLEQSTLWRLIRRIPLARDHLAVASPHTRRMDTDWLNGACVLVRQAALDAVGPLDEQYHFYWEEADLCRRLRRDGWRVVFEPAAQAVHVGGGSGRVSSMLLHFFRSLYIYYTIHYSPRQLAHARAIVRLLALWKISRAGVTYLGASSGAALACLTSGSVGLSPLALGLGDERAPERSAAHADGPHAMEARRAWDDMRLWRAVLRL